MLEMIISIALGVIVGLSGFTVLTVAIMFSPKFMEWYTKQIMAYFERLNEINYEDLKNEVKESY